MHYKSKQFETPGLVDSIWIEYDTMSIFEKLP